MSRRLLLVFVASCALLGPRARVCEAEDPPVAEAETLEARLRKHVERLTGEPHGGRDTPARRAKTADTLAAAFGELGLVPVPGRDTMIHEQEGGPESLRHVVGWLPAMKAASEAAERPYLLVASHYDGSGGVLSRAGGSPGANDNASGVAALLEIARAMTTAKAPTRARAVCFVAIDKQRPGGQGGRQLFTAPPLPIEQCVGVITFETLGRSLLNLKPGFLYVMGTEHSAFFERHAKAATHPAPERAMLVGSDVHLDHVTVFQSAAARKIPYAYLSSGISLDWGTKYDRADRLLYPQLAARTAYLQDLVARAAADPEAPQWRDPPAASIDELREMRIIAAGIRAQVLPRYEFWRPLAGNLDALIERMDVFLAKGAWDAAQRKSIVVRVRALVTTLVAALARSLSTR